MSTMHESYEDDNFDEYEDFQYEETYELAHEFVNGMIMPMIKEFDYNNSNEDYIPGIACYTLLTELVKSMSQQGFTVEQIQEIVAENAVATGDDIVH